MNRYKPRDDTSILPGAAYIRFSSELQSDSFSLDAQLRQIKEQAERDGVEIVKVFADPAQSAYRKKYRPGITAMREAARRGEFKILYVHKVDRLARRLEWSLEIVHELQELDILFKAVQQPFDLSTPEGKLLFHLVSSLGEFYSDNLSKETNKGKLERSLQGYHNAKVPWGYISVEKGNRKVGVPDPEKASIVVEMFERYASDRFSDMQIAEWLNSQGLQTDRGHPFGKDTVRDMLSNLYYAGKIRYRGMSVRPKGVSVRATTPKIAIGQHEAIISEELWRKSQEVRASRRVQADTKQKTASTNLLQGLVVCARCGRKLRVQTNKSGPTYYREDSHLRGYRDCSDISQCVRVTWIDDQVSALILSLKLPPNWEDAVRRLCQQQREGPDPETERKDIRNTIRLMRDNYERGLYEGDEYQYWQKVSALKEKLDLLSRLPESSIEQAASTLLNLRESWLWATKEERRELTRLMIQEVGVDVANKRAVWVKTRPDFDMLFQLLNNLRVDEHRRFWIILPEVDDDTCNMVEEDTQQLATEVGIAFPMSHNALTTVEEYVQ
jgi:DNA invertase Pin-like site-specific DNA recombinase